MAVPKYKVGIALSGGSTRGIAHIGVLKALLEHDIVPEIVSGTSAGSIIGALYAAGKTPDEMLGFIKRTNIFKVFRPGFPLTGVTDLTYLRERLKNYIDVDSFDALKIPFYVFATNMNTGEETRFTSGTLFDKIMASCSIPLIFKPVEIDGNLYSDGGIVNNLPAECLRKQCRVVIGANVVPLSTKSNRSLDSLMGILQRTFELAPAVNARYSARYCDVLIEPTDLNQFNFFSLQDADLLFQKGYEATLLQIPYIKQLQERWW